MIRNIDDCKCSSNDGGYGGNSCLKEGLLIDGVEYLVKYPRNAAYLSRHEEMLYTNDTVSEFLGSHIYSILGYPVHDTFLAERKNKIVVCCRDFVNYSKGQRLVEIRQIRNSVNNKYFDFVDSEFLSSALSHVLNFDEMLFLLDNNVHMTDVPGVRKRFFDQIVVDALIKNSDRNNGNWGFIREPNKNDVLAPIFDNGGAFSGKVPDSRLKRMLDDGTIIKHYANAISVYGDGEVNYSIKKILNFQLVELRNALMRNVPNIERHLGDIFALIDSVDDIACSKVRKEFYKKEMELRFDNIIMPAYQMAKYIEDNCLQVEEYQPCLNFIKEPAKERFESVL